MTYTLALLIFTAAQPNSPNVTTFPEASAEICWKTAAKFLQEDPTKYGAIALGAGCIAQPKGNPT